MSQIYKSLTSGPVPPSVPTSFVTDVNSPSIPAGNIENVFGGTSTANNTNGIRTDGSSGGNTLTIQLTNRFSATTTTVGATTVNAITFPLGATPGTFFFNFTVAAFEAVTPSGAGYETYTTVITNGVTASVLGDTDAIVHESAALIATNAELVISGNSAVFRVTGVAGLTINWTITGTYSEAT